MNHHIGRLVLSSLCVGAFGTGSLQNEHHPKPAAPNLQQRTENKTTDVVIQQHSRKLLKMYVLMSETC
jgi:hypothetical protein